MQKNKLKEVIFAILEIDVESSQMRDFQFEAKFEKKILKLKGKEAFNVFTKIIEILKSEDLNRYKNLKYSLKRYKRVHVNTSYVILFYDDTINTIFFEDYEHHDKIYKQ
ncbi:MAG: type II toxin-antitoxin system RelE family toxin [Candidatus Woesearchaeota archaeon]